MVFIYTTCRDTEEAKRIGKAILQKRLAVCVNILPIESIYHSEEGLKEDREAGLLIKTNEPKVADIEALIVSSHSYSVPFVGVIEGRRLNREYREWMGRIIQ